MSCYIFYTYLVLSFSMNTSLPQLFSDLQAAEAQYEALNTSSSSVQMKMPRNLHRAKLFMHTSARMHSILKHSYLSQKVFDSRNLLKWNAW